MNTHANFNTHSTNILTDMASCSGSVKTPAFVIHLGALEANLQQLADVQSRAGCNVLLALKGFAAWRTASLVQAYLSGVAVSSPHEAQLGHEEFRKTSSHEVHAYAPAYSTQDFQEILRFSDHVVFNSISQFEKFAKRAPHTTAHTVQFGLRINPEHSEVATALYDPCAPGSRLGVTRQALDAQWTRPFPATLTGLHFHTLCELGSDALERTLRVVEANFGDLLAHVSWVNFGGGHHITRADYDVARLVKLIEDFRARHHVKVYLEPGEAVGLGAGVLMASVLDIVHNNGTHIAILDTSATAHMPDVLEMPYRPAVFSVHGPNTNTASTKTAQKAGLPGEYAHTFCLGGLTCLAGDVIGDYSFETPLCVGDKLIFEDMAHYTMVKTSTFNGVCLPDIVLYNPDAPPTNTIDCVRRFGYEDYRDRLS